jgi:hypothetical protein
MKFFDTLWDWLAREKREAFATSEVQGKPRAQAGGRAEAPAKAKPVRRPRARREIVTMQQVQQADGPAAPAASQCPACA